MVQRSTAIFRKSYSLKVIIWLLAIILGAIQVWANRYTQSADDIISYLDIGDAYIQGRWDVAINAYWSPLYSWLLGLALYVVKPSSYWEFLLVKLVNFFIYLFALISFEFFLRELVFSYNIKAEQDLQQKFFKLPEWVCISGYTLFIWSSLQWLGVDSDSPDMLVAALVYLASGLVLRISTQSRSGFSFVILGAVLGFSYLAKAAMLPIAFVFLGIGAFSVGNFRKALPQVLAALLVFIIIVSPFIAALSTSKGRLTFSDTGKLNYVWSVTGGVAAYRFWQGEEPNRGTPKHPPRKIFDAPKVFEFATPIGGTYPPWQDPSYWYEGLAFKFDLQRQLLILWNNTVFYYQQFLGGLIFGYLILVCMCGRFWLSIKDLSKNWRLLIPAVAGLGIYMLAVDMPIAFRQMRYIAPFVVLLFAGVFSSVRLPNSPESKKLIAAMTIATTSFLSGSQSPQTLNDLWNVVWGQKQHVEWQVADNLQKLGVEPSERVAILGFYMAPNYHWARLARVKIVAEVSDERNFWEKDATTRAKILETIKKTGARAIVQKPGFKLPDFAFADGWREVGTTGYYVYFLSNSP